MKQVDMHAHVFEPGLKLASVRRYAPTYTASIEDFIANFESKGLNCGCLIQPSFLGTDNSYMLQAIDAYPTKMYGVAVIDPETITFEELQEMNNHNIIGIRLNLYGVELPDLKSDAWVKCLAYIKKLNWHVELHFDAVGLIDYIDTLLSAGVKVVIDHFGKPNPEAPLEDPGFKHILSVGATKRVWVKVSACYRLGGLEKGKVAAKQMIPALLAAFGSERLLWGSDWPHTQFESDITHDLMWEAFEEIIPAEHRENILSRAFEEILP